MANMVAEEGAAESDTFSAFVFQVRSLKAGWMGMNSCLESEISNGISGSLPTDRVAIGVELFLQFGVTSLSIHHQLCS